MTKETFIFKAFKKEYEGLFVLDKYADESTRLSIQYLGEDFKWKFWDDISEDVKAKKKFAQNIIFINNDSNGLRYQELLESLHVGKFVKYAKKCNVRYAMFSLDLNKIKELLYME